MRSSSAVTQIPLAILTASMVAGCSPAGNPAGRVIGQEAGLGSGTISTYAELDGQGQPSAIGVLISSSALEGLPSGPTDGHHCFDRDGNGRVDTDMECTATHEFVVPLPDVVATRSDVPFKWMLFNWNPVGHIPPGIYDVSHFDVHFYMAPIADVFALANGPCGPEFVNCDQFEIAKKPLPASYMSPGFQDVDGVAPAMGNHLIDVTGPEFNGEVWKRSWIFGAYDGHVTFYEEMLTLDLLRSQPDACYPIKMPAAVEQSGWYPTQSCVRYEPSTNAYTVSIEGFEFREASPPGPVTD